MSLCDRAAAYNQQFVRYPGSALVVTGTKFISGVWLLGNNYRGSGFYGAYPPQYLKRVMALFPDAKRVMHLFSGSLSQGDYTRIDIKRVTEAWPEIECDAHQLAKACKGARFDLIIADPPYTKADAERYGTPMIHRKRVLEQCSKVMQPGGHVVWLDTVWPMIAKKHLVLVGAIGILRSQNHRVRFAFIMQKPGVKSK
jgi:hypothetical protein